MANFVFANNIKTTVASAFSNVATSLTLASSTGLPALSAGQVLPITLQDAATGLVYEICYATAITGSTLTVTRAQEGTAAQNWSVGDRAYCAPTALSVAPVNGNGLNVFQVANAVASNEAVNLGQAQADFLAIGGNAVSATNGFQSGDVKASASASAQTGWLPCDGAAVSRTTYAALYAALGTVWGVGDGSTTFNIPDFRGRALIGDGTGTGLTARTVGQEAIGVETVTTSGSTITLSNPPHVHSYSAIDSQIGGVNPTTQDTAASTQATSISANNSAATGTTDNMQPSAVIHWLIKT